MIRARQDIAKIREEIDYDPGTGLLIYKRDHGRVKKGDKAIHRLVKGYLGVSVYCHPYRAHILAWAIATGEWPTVQLDHINGVRTDNRLANLRLATNRLNCMNREYHRNGKECGVERHRSKWRARAWVNGRNITIGSYSSKDEALVSYQDWVRSNDRLTAVLAAPRPEEEAR